MRSRCRCALKKAFLYRWVLHELKKFVFFANQKFSIYRKFYALLSKASRFRNQKTACLNHFLLSSKTAFSRIKNFLLHKPFLACFKTAHFYKPKVFLLHKPFLLPPKETLFHPPLPIPTTLNLLFAKNTAILLIFALTPCAVKPESRTDSNHCRRYPAKLRLCTKPVT